MKTLLRNVQLQMQPAADRSMSVQFRPPAPQAINMSEEKIQNERSKKLVENLFKAFFALEDLREILRKTTPFHNLSKEQKSQALRLIDEAKEALAKMKKEL